MHEFLDRLRHAGGARRCTTASTSAGTTRAQRLNARLRGSRLPVRVANLSSIWTVCYTAAVALQLDAAVLPARRRAWRLSWVGTGRLIFSLNYTDADFEAVARALRGRRARDAGRRLVVGGRRR